MNSQTILIAEDDRVAMALLTKLVQKLEYNVLQARDGEEALQLIKERPVDLIISDYEMPKMNGLTLLRAVKSEYPSLPFILVTAHSNLKVIRDAWFAGAFDFFEKPLFIDRLNQTVQLAIGFGHVSLVRGRFPDHHPSENEPGMLDMGVLRELTVALGSEELGAIIEEFDIHSRVDLEQIIRCNFARKYPLVRERAHKLAGTSINLGLEIFTQKMRAIEMSPEKLIDHPVQLELLLSRSIYFLKMALRDVAFDIAS